MNKRQSPISVAIKALPDTLDLNGLVEAARRILRNTLNGNEISTQQVSLYIQQELVDPPAKEAPAYRHRHLLQIVAIHSLRGLDLNMTRIRELVQGVDDSYLRMLCDEPVEAEKKAAVMSNWLKMLSNGRVGRPERGETHMLNAPNPELAPRPEMHVAPAHNSHGVAPALEMTPTVPPRAPPPPPFSSATPSDLPTGHPPIDLPDRLPRSRQAQPGSRDLRAARPTFAASQSLADALKKQMERPDVAMTPQVPLRVPGGEPPEDSDAPTQIALTLPQSWTRLRLAEGVEVHVRASREPVPADEIDALLAQVRGLMGG